MKIESNKLLVKALLKQDDKSTYEVIINEQLTQKEIALSLKEANLPHTPADTRRLYNLLDKKYGRPTRLQDLSKAELIQKIEMMHQSLLDVFNSVDKYSGDIMRP